MGTFHQKEKTNICDDAITMTLMVILFPFSVNVAHSTSYNNVSHTRSHDSYLPSSPATLQALDRMEYAMVNAIAPPDVRIVGPHFKVPSHSPSVPGYIQKFDPWVPPFV